MRFAFDSYEEIEEEAAVLFFREVAKIREEINAGKTTGRTYNELRKAGLSVETLGRLKASKFVSWHDKNEPVWFAWTNSYYDDRTIEKLYNFYIDYCCYNLPKVEFHKKVEYER